MFKKPRLDFSSQYWLLFILNFLIMMVNNIQGILPDHLHALGAPDTLIALFTNIPNILLVSLVLLSFALDLTRFRIKLVFLGFCCALLGALLGIFFSQDLIALYLSRFFLGIGFALEFSFLFGLMYDFVRSDRRRSGAAVFGISGLLTGAMGSTLAQQLYLHFPVYSLYIAVGAFAVFGIVGSFFIRVEAIKKSSPGFQSLLSLLRTKGFFLLVIISLIFGGAFGGFWTFLARMSRLRLGIPEIQGFFFGFSSLSILIRIFISPVMDGFSRNRILLVAFVSALLAYTLFSFYQDAFLLVVIGLLYGITHSLVFPTLSSSFVDLSEGDRTVASNIFLALFTGGNFLISSILGAVSDFWTLELIPYVMMGFCFLALILLPFLKSRTKKTPALS